ncbi:MULTISPECIES: helix-turn-helix transcriptional regulator [unclassified Janthinobacterium]|uniref:helix-turn-helix transcriptional regulator n=1 Tax=unclassified Janthinobacterium TaxID=2610881 RepID=UPI0003469A98|nr:MULTISPECIES: helix-turn-helix transcriptional regulator [unclassified Janthinobacterium]MEC5160059.1 AraC-like DNA-binding protein [Janthinobacterium sp. CG_S6]
MTAIAATATTTACLIATRAAHRVARMTIREPMFGWVQSGRKTLIGRHVHQHYGAGQAFLLAQGTQWDVVNEPAPGGHYRALILQFSPALIEQFHALYGAQFPATRQAPFTGLDMTAELRDSAQRAFEARAGLLQTHRLLEVLLLLAEAGVAYPPPGAPGWDERVRRMVGQRPHADWTLALLAEAFHTSASTLRRRLHACDASFAGILREARLETALALLQSTPLAVGDIALRCGYQSHSRFSAAFRRRFGFPPKQLRPPEAARVA